VGGGTGLMRTLLPPAWEYTCLDNDPQKLSGFQKKFPSEKTIKASATKIPKPNNTYDLCILSAVSHHLQSSELDCALKEISRVLRPNGQLLFLDALLNPDNVAGKILWALDRGSFPRAFNDLRRHLENEFVITRSKTWKALHEYALLFCRKKPS
jgi:ubiquinone/menaquinone biosynthesis C-methylase UbiE